MGNLDDVTDAFNPAQALATLKTLDLVAVERIAQQRKWGEQNHPDGTGPTSTPLNIRGETNGWVDESDSASLLAELFTETTDSRFGRGDGTWRDILLEEVFEALAEDDPDKLRAELIQTAAVAVAWVEAIDRRNV